MSSPEYGGGPNPIAQFQQDVQNFDSSPNSLQGILGQLESGIAPTVAQSELQAALAGNQYSVNQQQYGLTSTNLEQQAANQLGQLGIGYEQIGLQGQGLAAQAGLLGTTTGLEQQGWGLEQQNWALQQQGFGLEQQQYGVSATQYPEQLAEAALNYNVNRENLVGNMAASGALNTQGSTQQQNVLLANYGFQRADIGRAQELAALGQQQTLLGQQEAGIGQQQAVLGQAATTAQQQYSAADIARQQQNLQLVAQQNGLSVQEVQQQLAYGLSQAGLDLQQNLPQLLNSLSSIYGGDLSQVEGAAGELGLLGGTSLANIGNMSNVNVYSPGVPYG
jgi:hypothetical protein